MVNSFTIVSYVIEFCEIFSDITCWGAWQDVQCPYPKPRETVPHKICQRQMRWSNEFHLVRHREEGAAVIVGIAS